MTPGGVSPQYEEGSVLARSRRETSAADITDHVFQCHQDAS